MAADELTEEKRTELRKLFDQFDQDKSGVVDGKELKCAMQHLGMNTGECELQSMMRSVDLDGSGTIDFKEFCNLMVYKMSDIDGKEDLIYALKLLDISEPKGFLDVSDFRNAMMQHGEEPMDQATMDLIIADAEKRGMVTPEGKLDYTKFCSMMLE